MLSVADLLSLELPGKDDTMSLIGMLNTVVFLMVGFMLQLTSVFLRFY